MNLYIINADINDALAKYLLDHCTEYNDQPCDIIEIINRDNINFTQGYLDKLTIGKLKYQLTIRKINYYINYDKDEVIYYLYQTKQIKLEDIHDICYVNAYKSLQILLLNGVNIEFNNNILTPLHTSCWKNSLQCVKILLKAGANINSKTISGYTPMYAACLHDSIECVKIIFKHDKNTIYCLNNQKQTLLHAVCQSGSTRCTEFLLLNGANVNVQDSDGNTPLHMACSKTGAYNSVKLLFEHGADPDIRNNNDKTPIDLSCTYNRKYIKLFHNRKLPNSN